MNSLLLHYKALAQFNKNYRKGLLNVEHLESGRRHFQKFWFKKTKDQRDVDYWAYLLERSGTKYLIDFKEGKPSDVLPVLVTDSETVAHKGLAFEMVTDYQIARFRSEKRMTFRALVDSLTKTQHSNPAHQKLLMFMALSQTISRANYRVCSPPGTGKDSSVQTLASLVGGCSSIVSPTLAKLEYRTQQKWLVVNEAVDVTEDKWRDIEQFLLDVGAGASVVEKHSRGYKDVEETLDISNFSLSLFFNDITAYPKRKQEKYFDTVTKEALRDRFPPFRIYGAYTERWDRIHSVDVTTLVEENEVTYKDLIYTIVYYTEHVEKELNRYNTRVLDAMLSTVYVNGVPQRHHGNLLVLLKMVDLYCESQEEFDGWCTVIVAAMRDYYEMLEYPELEEKAKKKQGRKAWPKFKEQLDALPTFTEKNAAIRNPDSVKDVKVQW